MRDPLLPHLDDPGSEPQAAGRGDDRRLTNLVIRARDGTDLVADLYLPRGAGPFPAIVERTPYGAHRLENLGRVYASRGYLFLAVDVRGRYRSAGVFDPLVNEESDGADVLDWIGHHPRSNGSVGTRGESYAGSNQLFAALSGSPFLKAMVVVVAPGEAFHNVPFQGGAYDMSDLFWLLGTIASSSWGPDAGEGDKAEVDDDDEDDGDDEDDEDDEDDDANADEEEARFNLAEERLEQRSDEAMLARPFCELDVRLGRRSEIFREWVRHWRLDEYWKARSALSRIHQIRAHVLHISGWYDGNGRGAPMFYAALRRSAATPEAREHQRLILGPWNHDLEAPDADDLTDAERRDLIRGAETHALNAELAWFEEHLKGLPRIARGRVELFMTGVNRWVELEDWPIPGAEPWTLYLSSGGDAHGSDGGGRLVERPPESDSGGARPDRYTMDPEHPTPHSPAHAIADREPFDNAPLEEPREDTLIYSSDPLTEDVIIAGDVDLRLFAASTALDVDYVVKLHDVHPDGRSIFLTDGVIRARFRHGFEEPRLLVPGQVEEYGISLWHIGHVFRRGHRIRIAVASAAFDRFDVNPCTGGDLATETRAVVAEQKVLHDARHPSCLSMSRLRALP